MSIHQIGDVLRGGLFGIRDALCGISAVMKMNDSRQKENENQPERANQHAQGVLALRRERRNNGGRSGDRNTNEKISIVKRLFHCSALNGFVVALSFLMFELFMSALSAMFASYTSWNSYRLLFEGIFGILWICPVFLMSWIINMIWFQDIAEQTFKQVRGRKQPIANIAQVVTDFLLTLIIQVIFAVQSFVVSLLPAPYGIVISIVHNALLNSLYTFEYKWYNLGKSVDQRITIIEENWPYFVGFGIPLAFVQYKVNTVSSRWVGGAIYSALFPLFIISAHQPVQLPRKAPKVPFFKAAFWLTSVVCSLPLAAAAKKHTDRIELNK